MTTLTNKAMATPPHERRVQRFAFVALAASALLGFLLATRAPGKVLASAVPTWAMLALVAGGAVVGTVAVVKRSTLLAAASTGLLVLGVAPAGALAPGILGYGLGFLFGALVLAFAELVQQTSRYDVAHKLVDEEGVPEESLDRVTDEAVRTLGVRIGLALLASLGAVLAALLLASAGPAAWREGVETAAPLGVAVLALGLLGLASLSILAQGARFRVTSEDEPVAPQEVAP